MTRHHPTSRFARPLAKRSLVPLTTNMGARGGAGGGAAVGAARGGGILPRPSPAPSVESGRSSNMAAAGTGR